MEKFGAYRVEKEKVKQRTEALLIEARLEKDKLKGWGAFYYINKRPKSRSLFLIEFFYNYVLYL